MSAHVRNHGLISFPSPRPLALRASFMALRARRRRRVGTSPTTYPLVQAALQTRIRIMRYDQLAMGGFVLED